MSAAAAELRFDGRPSTLGYMLRALHRTPDPDRVDRFPPLRAQWRGQRAYPEHLATFAELTGLNADDRGAGVLYPHVLGFPLQMAILTHPRFPVPIWRVLQVRNHLIQHRPIPLDAELDWETQVGAQRFLAKGAEVDLHTAVCARGELVWEGINTFYFRGAVRGDDPPSGLARAPEVAETAVASWHMPPGIGWRFAGLTGDYNGIHYWDWYARRFGFSRAFHHPQAVIGQCLARLPAPDELPQRLDVWLKGPVFYGSDVQLRAGRGDGGATFSLRVGNDDRPAIVGRWAAHTGGGGGRP